MVMRALQLLLVLLFAACDSTAPSGTLGLPTARPTPAPTAASRTSSPGANASGTVASASPGASGSPGISASPSPTGALQPKVLAASATQFLLTVKYSAPMRSATPCGSVGQPSALEGAIDRVDRYSSNDDALKESIKSTLSATVSADCSAVTLVFAVAAPSGSFSVSAIGMVDRSGTNEDPSATTVAVTIADEGRPRVTGVFSQVDRIVVEFSEPMRELGPGGLTVLGSYRLDGSAIDAQSVGCADVGCRKVALMLRAGTLVVGRTYQLSVANVADRAGLAITPDPTTLTFVARS